VNAHDRPFLSKLDMPALSMPVSNVNMMIILLSEENNSREYCYFVRFNQLRASMKIDRTFNKLHEFGFGAIIQTNQSLSELKVI
jgi:hypothetical protein